MLTKNTNLVSLRSASHFYKQVPINTRKCGPKVIEPMCDPKDKNMCKDKELKLADRISIAEPKSSMGEFICRDMPIRFDELYYKMSNKRTRKYPQTWVTPPELRIKLAEICLPLGQADPDPMPTRNRRTRKKLMSSCHGMDYSAGDLMPCKLMPKPLCKLSRKPRKCGRNALFIRPPKCKKQPTPYPCFSECKRVRPRSLRPIECKCLDKPAMCEAWERFRIQLTFVKGVPDGPCAEKKLGCLIIGPHPAKTC
uniref:Uncharacterized protein n=1 Tax=Glossina austeni TaxID=7395 RepID=A0A1A9VTE4_GLOAU